MFIKGAELLLAIAVIIWFFWMTKEWLVNRNKPKK